MATVVLLAGGTRVSHAQSSPDSAAVVDSARREAVRDANKPPTAHRGVIAFFGGLPAGFALPIAFGAPQALLIGGAGVGVIVASAEMGSARPPGDLASVAAARGPLYARVYGRAYESRLQARRRRSAWIGGAVGGGVGAAFLVTLIIALSDANY